MNASIKLAREIEEAYSGEPWHGSSLRPLLRGLSATAAFKKPIDRAHSIWELVLHITTWKDVVRERLEGETRSSVPASRDWPPVSSRSQSEWDQALRNLDRAHQRLVAAVERLPEDYLNRTVAGVGSTYREMLRGSAMHDTYHGGQIAVLAKVSRA